MRGDVVIVGGGISGLAAAYYLVRGNAGVTLVERRPRLGGVIETNVVEGCVIEGGPDSFLSAKPAALELVRELGLGDQVIGSNDHLRVTYVRKGGRLVPLPDGLMLMVPTRVLPMAASPLLSWGTKIRMGLEYLRRPPSGPRPDRSVAEFIEDHYGAEAVDYLAEPLLAGVYGGDPRRLSIDSVLTRFVELEAQYGSLTRGVLAERKKAAAAAAGAPLFRTLMGGLAQLTRAIEAAILPKIRVVHGNARTVESAADGYRVKVDEAWLEASHVVLAAPAYEAGALVEGIEPRLAALLTGIEYSSSMTVALGYRRARLKHPLNGFGFLVPKKERGRMVACTWVGTKFSHRIPDDWAVLRCFLGGAGDHEILEEDDETVAGILREELRGIMGVDAAPDFCRISRWPRSMAQFTVGHAARVRQIEELLRARAGLYVAGNAYYGIGIPDCIRMGRAAAANILKAA